jgi:hypothetical protein
MKYIFLTVVQVILALAICETLVQFAWVMVMGSIGWHTYDLISTRIVGVKDE